MGRRSGKRGSKQDTSSASNGESPRAGTEPKPSILQKFSSLKIAETRLGQWLQQEKWTLIFIVGIFLLAFLIRTVFFAEVAFSTWPPRLAGNDPMYHKWAIDYFQTHHRHYRLDPMLNYPLYGGNPRPPVFDWSVAVLGLALGPLFGGTGRATWYVFEFSPSVWGSLTVFPIYFIGKEIFGKKEGMLASLLFALSPAHIERSVLGFSDHDAIIVFFLVLSYFFLLKGLSTLEDRKWVKDWRRPGDVILGFRDLFKESQIPLAYFMLSGVCVGTVALTWKGFPYLLAIILIYYLVQIVFNKFRKVDSLSFFVAIFIVMALPLAMSLPYYYVFTVNTWMTPFFIVMAMVAIGVMFVPTRDIPWIVVIPAIGLFLGGSYAFLHFASPDTRDLLFTGGGYFVKTKLYSTIAEAQKPDLSRMIISITPAVFFAAVVGIAWAAILIPKRLKKDFLFIVTWGGVAIFMAISAVRFEFNAMPIFCILAGWIIMKAIKKFNPTGITTLIVSLVAVAILGLLLVLNFYQIDSSDSKWHFKPDDYWFFDKIGLHDSFTSYLQIVLLVLVLVFTIGLFLFLKYFLKKEKYKLGTIMVALGVAFIIIMPGFLLAIDACTPYEKKRELDPDFKYMGSFGSSFTSEYWESGMDWLADQDTNLSYEDRPAWISWWDYGFWSVYLGQHPTVADNFQNGYQLAGSFISSQNESEAIALMTIRILEGNFVQNARDTQKREFSSDVKEILIKHLDGGNMDVHPNYDRFLRYYRNPGDYTDTVENDPNRFGHYIDLKAPNAKYAMARVDLMDLGKEGIVDLYTDVNQATGDSIEYFGVDSRLFPFNARNTGIFYAPIKLADKDVNDYLIYLAYCQRNEGTQENPNWVDYPDNPLPPDRVEEEAERLESDFRIKDYDLKYSDLFYNSMFYKCYIGWSAKDVGAPLESNGVPSMFGEIARYPAMQGWNMTHFKSVYKTMYYSPNDEANSSFPTDYTPMNYDESFLKYRRDGGDIKSGLGQGVFMLKYYHGATLNGTLQLPNGTPVAGARIVVQDEFGVPHGVYITPADGSYSLILPFGSPKILVTKNELRPASENLYDHIYGYKIDTQTFGPVDPYNVSAFLVTDEMAMRTDPDWQMEQDITILPASMRGRIFYDWDNNARYESERDDLVEKAYLRLEMEEGDRAYKNAYGYEKQGNLNYRKSDVEEKIIEEPIINGEVYFKDLVPGIYKYKLIINGHPVEISEPLEITPGDNLVGRDIVVVPSNVTGGVLNPNGTRAEGISIKFTDELTNKVVDTYTTGSNGTFSFDRFLPGNYTLALDQDGFFRDIRHLTFAHGEINSSDFNLIPVATVKGVVSYAGSTLGQFPAENVIVQFSNPLNESLSRAVFTAASGNYSVDLAQGTYQIYAKSIEGQNVFTALGLLEVTSLDERYTYDLELTNSIQVNGTITKLENTPVLNGEVKFKDEDGNLLVVISNNTGDYRAYLPYGKYTVDVYHVSDPGNNTFIHQSKLDLTTMADSYYKGTITENSLHPGPLVTKVRWVRARAGMTTNRR
jgi:dolichyl-diphosphooligosaccharide--protein glycosyltransferase